MTKTPESANSPATHHSPLPSFSTGVIIILVSSMIISLQNIITRVILSKKVVLGVWETGGFLIPSMGNSILLLVLRMLVALPILAFLVAPRIYKNTWVDLRK